MWKEWRIAGYPKLDILHDDIIGVKRKVMDAGCGVENKR